MPDVPQPPTCFVAMPIRSAGSDDHRHFQAIYENISDVVTSHGFQSVRADKVHGPGNIAKDIIMKLAQAALVIADLSDLNPNVFYEIGIRHAIRRNGTILLIDKAKSPTIPFDLSAYRVIVYEGDLAGVRLMRQQLDATVRSLAGDQEGEASTIDSPLHDWFPELPSNLIVSSRAKISPAVASELQDLRRQVEHYREMAKNPEVAKTLSSQSASTEIQRLRQADEAGELAQHYIKLGAESFNNGDVAGFLDAVDRLIRSREVPERHAYMRFSTWADQLGLPGLALAILREASGRLINSNDVKSSLIRRMSRSTRSEDRLEAYQALSDAIGLDSDTESLTGARDMSDPKTVRDLGYFVEMLHESGRDDLGLKILREAMALHADPTTQRHLARQLDWLGKDLEAFNAYKEGIRIANGDQESFRWFANFLHNGGYHVEAAELFVLETFYDLSDGSAPAHFADEISYHLFDYFALNRSLVLREVLGEPRDLPAGADADLISQGLFVSLSTGPLSTGLAEIIDRVIERADISLPEILPHISKAGRLSWAHSVYDALRSELTMGCMVGERLLAASPAVSSQSKVVDSQAK